MPWVWFVIVQLVCGVLGRIAAVLVLPWFCLLQSWHDVASELESGRTIDAWDSLLLQWWAGSAEDGVSGRWAKVWEGGARVAYMPGRNPAWRAICWSIGRNPAAALTDLFAWEAGPLLHVPFTFRGQARTFKAGWQREIRGKIPVLSL